MISQDELVVMQLQLVGLSEENAELASKIEDEQVKRQMTPLIRDELDASRKLLDEENKKSEQREKKLRGKLERARSPKFFMRLGKGAFDLISSIGSDKGEEGHLEELEEQLVGDGEKLGKLQKREISMSMRMAEAATKEQEVTSKMEAIRDFINEFQVVEPQIRMCTGYPMMVQDLASRLDRAMDVDAGQNGRVYRFRTWGNQIAELIDNYRRTIDDMGAEKVEIIDRIIASRNTTRDMQEKLATVQMELSGMTLAVADQETETENVRKGAVDACKAAKQGCVDAELSISDVDRRSVAIRAEIDGYDVSKQRLLRKKVEKIAQLKRRIKVEREGRVVIDVNSPEVIRLIGGVKTEMEDKEAMEIELRKKEEELHRLRSKSEKKDLVIMELGALIPGSRTVKGTEEEALVRFSDFLNDRQVQNDLTLESMESAGMNIGELEGDKENLAYKIREMEGS